MTSIDFYERSTIIKRIEDNLNEINRNYFEGNHGILLVTDNGDYVTVCSRNGNQHFDVQGIFDALNNFSLKGFDDRDYYDIWDYLDFCKYTLPEDQKLLVKLENLLDEIDCTYFSHCSELSIEQQNDEIVNICKNDECLSFFIEPLVSSLDNVSDIDHSFDDLWDYLEYEFLFHGVKSDNGLKTNDGLSFSEKRQVALVDMLLSESVPASEFSDLDEWTVSLIPHLQTVHTEASTLSKLVDELDQENKRLKESIKSLAFSRENDYQECLKYTTLEENRLNNCIKQLQEEYQELERKNEILWEKNRELEQNKEYSQTWIDNLKQRVYDLECAVHLLRQENKQLKSNQETNPETKPEPKPTAKRPKFKLPENFADYQQECDDLIDALSCFYTFKKGKWGKDILQFILTPTDAEKAKHPYPDKWKAGLYLQPGQWTVDKVNQSDPDSWQDWFMDINDFADSNDIEIS